MENVLRTDKHTYFLDLALRCAKQSTCLRRGFGAVIVDDKGTIISTGYNGAPKGIMHCKTCWREDNNIPSGSNYEKCLSVHAEQNALIQAGKKARGCTMYLTGIDMKTAEEVYIMPCFLCAKMILNAEIECVVMRNELPTSLSPLTIYMERYKEAFTVSEH